MFIGTFHQLPSVRLLVAGHPDDALPLLFEISRDNFSNLPRHQKEAVLDDLEEISQVFVGDCFFFV